MTRIICLSFIIFFYYSNKLSSEEQDSVSIKQDTLNVISPKDTVSKGSDSLSLNILKEEADIKRSKKIRIVRRNFSYRTQIGAALFMMGLVVIILVSVDNLNPN
ncbi:MAG: hypothetical protein PVI26_07675 [Chitinispirillia bacterium]|jgi:hypothetical protein